MDGLKVQGSDFDPDVIGAELVQLHDGTATDTGIVYVGATAAS